MIAIRSESERDLAFADWVKGLKGAENIQQCIHCGMCSGSCPLGCHMDLSPRRLMHLAREGWKDDVLGSKTIWLCTSCYACTAKCPRDIPVTDVLYALKRRAIDEKAYPSRFPPPVLAEEFRNMIRAHGRASESRLMLRLAIRTDPRGLLKRVGLGRDLMRTGRFDPGQDRVKNREQLRTLLERVHREEVPS